MEVDYLLVEDVIEIHDQALRDYGGLSGVDLGKLEAILLIPMAGYGEFEKYPTIIGKAAVYLYYLASGHAFKDANKLTSYLVTLLSLI